MIGFITALIAEATDQEIDALAAQRDAYVRLACLAASYAQTVADLEQWWRDQAIVRLNLGIEKNDPDYLTMTAACAARKKDIA
jgi:hypothetical protein